MRNYREMTDEEVLELERLYPTTVNRELSKMFDISVDAIQDYFAKPRGWQKDNNAVRIGNRGGHGLSEEDKKWIIKHYAHTKNKDIMDKYDVGESTLHRFARAEGLVKSKQFINKSRIENFAIATQVCKDHGIYEASAEQQRQRWEEYKKLPREQWPGWKPGKKPYQQPGVSTRKYNEAVRKGREKRRKLVKLERARITFGMEQQSKLRLGVHLDHRMSAIKHAMIKECNYFSIPEHTTWVLYDSETKRSERREAHAIEIGLRVVAADED